MSPACSNYVRNRYYILMKRRNFIELLTFTGSAVLIAPLSTTGKTQSKVQIDKDKILEKLNADVAIIGGGLGGVATAIAALRNGLTVVLTEETDWLGGQLTSQGVPPDEHQWIEKYGASQLYRDFRNGIRDYYRRNYPLTTEAKNDPLLNPGSGMVSRLCHEPKVALSVIEEMIAPYISNGKLVVLLNHIPIQADTKGNQVRVVAVKSNKNGKYKNITAHYFVDATELGDLLPLTGTEFITGTEAKSTHQELHAPKVGDVNNNQAFTMCFAIDHVPGEDHTIPKPKDYDFWANHTPALKPAWSGRILSLQYSDPRTLKPKNLGFDPNGVPTGETLNLWNYRKIVNRALFSEGFYDGDITIVNWPQNDYMLGNIVGANQKDFAKYVEHAKQLSLSLLYWLQTEAPRPDGRRGWPSIRLRKDIMGTADGMAKYPYVRESRRIKAVFTVTEEHIGHENRALVATAGENKTKAAYFYDSVGTGSYHIDLHPTCGGVNYVDFASLRFQIPLGALLPIRMDNILPANKNIGTTHITNGCFRLHPVEWCIGEAVGMLIAYAKSKNVTPRKVREHKELLKEFQSFIISQGLETDWPDED